MKLDAASASRAACDARASGGKVDGGDGDDGDDDGGDDGKRAKTVGVGEVGVGEPLGEVAGVAAGPEAAAALAPRIVVFKAAVVVDAPMTVFGGVDAAARPAERLAADVEVDVGREAGFSVCVGGAGGSTNASTTLPRVGIVRTALWRSSSRNPAHKCGQCFISAALLQLQLTSSFVSEFDQETVTT
jgi:hypothetical protein